MRARFDKRAGRTATRGPVKLQDRSAIHPSVHLPGACHGFVEEYILKPITTAGKVPVLNDGIRTFYDESSKLWESMWGEHMHHGYYDTIGSKDTTRFRAQVDMIEQTLRFAGAEGPQRILDVGCGIGGASRYMARKYGAETTGITLSPKQAARANKLSSAAGLSGQCSFLVADALHQPFQDCSFDFVWSLESGEHMPDKRRFVSELLRVTAPGGKIVIVTWCHRNLLPGENALKSEEKVLLDRICEAYYLPKWCSLTMYEKLFAELGLQDVKSEDWSDNVAPFWDQVIQSALTPAGMVGMLGAGWGTLKGALVMPLMKRGYEIGLIKFVAITGTKKEKAKKT